MEFYCKLNKIFVMMQNKTFRKDISELPKNQFWKKNGLQLILFQGCDMSKAPPDQKLQAFLSLSDDVISVQGCNKRIHLRC